MRWKGRLCTCRQCSSICDWTSAETLIGSYSIRNHIHVNQRFSIADNTALRQNWRVKKCVVEIRFIQNSFIISIILKQQIVCSLNYPYTFWRGFICEWRPINIIFCYCYIVVYLTVSFNSCRSRKNLLYFDKTCNNVIFIWITTYFFKQTVSLS